MIHLLLKDLLNNKSFAERFIGTLKNKSYKYMTSVSKNECIDRLDDIVNK